MDEMWFPTWMQKSESDIVDDLFLSIQNIVAGTATVSNTMMSETCCQYKIQLSENFPLITLKYDMKLNKTDLVHMIPVVDHKEIGENSEICKTNPNIKPDNFEDPFNAITSFPVCSVKQEDPELLRVLSKVKVNENEGLVSYNCSEDNQSGVARCEDNRCSESTSDSINNYDEVVTSLGSLMQIALEPNILTQQNVIIPSPTRQSIEVSVNDSNSVASLTTEQKGFCENNTRRKEFERNGIKNNRNIEKEERLDLNVQRHSCSYCGKFFKKKSLKLLHERVHTGEKPFKCEDCGKCFVTFSEHKTHKRIHTGEKPFMCVDCGKCFKASGELTRHKTIHSDEKPFKCEECGKCFKSSEKVNRHKRIHTGEKPFQCEECGKTFTFSSGLTVHKQIHTGEKPFKCEDCDKCFISKGALTGHKRIHTGEKPYKCEECGKTFTFSSGLYIHKRIHTGEKPFKCEDCGKTFTVSGALFVHRRIHTGEKPFQCEDCGKCFRLAVHIINHRRMHLGERPFKCEECGKGFIQSSDLTRHKKIHTGVNGLLVKK